MDHNRFSERDSTRGTHRGGRFNSGKSNRGQNRRPFGDNRDHKKYSNSNNSSRVYVDSESQSPFQQFHGSSRHSSNSRNKDYRFFEADSQYPADYSSQGHPKPGNHSQNLNIADNLNYTDSRNSIQSAGHGEIVNGRYIRRQSAKSHSHPQRERYTDLSSVGQTRQFAQNHSRPQREHFTDHGSVDDYSRTHSMDNFSRQPAQNYSRPQREHFTDRSSVEDYSRTQFRFSADRNYSQGCSSKQNKQFMRKNTYPNAVKYDARKRHEHHGELDENTVSTDIYRYYGASKSVDSFSTASNFSASSENLKYDATQRELLIQHLTKGECECLVCCEQIRVPDQTWHCLSCYHVFHLRCIRKWARSPAALIEDGAWRCPACQNTTSTIPFKYHCFCGKTEGPEVNYHLTPHTCGEICYRKRMDCSHECKELCHPGPCPPCSVVVRKLCPCGKTTITSPCNQSAKETCDSVCEKTLNCGIHECQAVCHTGTCSPCDEIISQNCHCSKSSQTVPCTLETANVHAYTCGDVCSKQLECGHHVCDATCHSGACSPCRLSPSVVRSCPCGKWEIERLVAEGRAKARATCQDAVPLCGEICDKVLACGPKDSPHRCTSPCHEGECPPCALSTLLKCRCGAFNKEFDCRGLQPSFVYVCERRCNKRKDCGRHKCLNNCCVSQEHRCETVCNKKLSCGLHQCQDFCHVGKCPTCWDVSFNELRCHCGETVMYPPIPCGTKPPECNKLCQRQHPCDHNVTHNCHSDASCPPCIALTVKKCFGKHKKLQNVLCYLGSSSCGMSCNKDLPCGNHKCLTPCHEGPCLKENAKCTQNCTIPRASCGHPCAAQCHDKSVTCPETPCKAQVTLTCDCGHRTETTTCHNSVKSHNQLNVSALATKLREIKEGQSVNLDDVMGKKSKSTKLQCSEECAIIERNKRLALALQIQNPDLSTSPGPPSYSEFLKTEARKNMKFVTDIYNKISDLVQLAKESKQKSRSISFPPMNRDQRRIVHELAEFFGCETQSYDEEPKKNVVVSAQKAKCWLPFVSVMTIVQRDMGFRKGPTPILSQRDTKSNSSTGNTNQKSSAKKIDYFDFTS